jgi:ABC-2 type transport system permease protein
MTIREFAALVDRDLRQWVRSPTTIISSLLLPFLYLLLFGQAFNNITGLAASVPGASGGGALATFSGAPDYYSYFTAGMVGFTLLGTSLFAGANVIFDRRFGVLKKIVSAPVAREVIFGARIFSAVVRGLIFGTLVFVIALTFAHVPGLKGLTVTAQVSVLGVVEIVLAMVLLTALFTAISVAIGFLIEQIDAFFAVINLVNLPVLFTSSALFPRTLLPPWLKTASDWNPISLASNVVRENLFSAAGSYYPEGPAFYLAVLAVVTVVFGVLTTAAVRWSLRPR